MRRFLWLAASSLLLASCTGVDAGLSTDGGQSTGSLTGTGSEGLGVLTAPYVVLDLDDGTVDPRSIAPDLAGQTDRTMTFRRISGYGPDMLMAICETTQAQWLRIAGDASAPWTEVPADVAGTSAVSSTRPAFNLSYDAISAGLSAWNAGRSLRLAIPSGGQWGFAAAGGSTGSYWWGSAADRTTLLSRAVVAEVADGVKGVRPVGQRLANAFGLYDTTGNIWEWTDGGTALRGGSWHDSVALGRTAAVLDAASAGLTPDIAHVLAGVRLILVP